MRVKRARQDNSAHSEIEISMRAWHLCVRTALSGVFVVIPEISHSDISAGLGFFGAFLDQLTFHLFS